MTEVKPAYEAETADETPIDTTWVLDGRGRAVRIEVEDDADN